MADANSWWFERRWSDFRRGTAEIVIRWADGSARAFLYTEGVHETATAFQSALPLEASFVHVAWSGEMVMGTQTFDFGPNHAENEIRLVRPGDLTWDSKFGELGLVYGTAECRLPSGPNCVTVFGSVIEGTDALAAFCRARRFEGIGTLRFESGE